MLSVYPWFPRFRHSSGPMLAAAAVVLCAQVAAAQTSSIIDLSKDVNGPCPSVIDLSGGDSRDCGRKAVKPTPENRTVGNASAAAPRNNRVRDLWDGPDPDQAVDSAQAAHGDQGRNTRRSGVGMVYIGGNAQRDGTEAKSQTGSKSRIRLRRR